MGSYLSQDEIDALLKGKSASDQAVSQEKQDNSRQQPPGKQDDQTVTGQEVKKGPLVERVEFAPLQVRPPSWRVKKPPLEFFQNISLVLSGELGAAEITVRDFLQLTVGSVVKLDKMAGESAAVLLNGQYLGQAEVIVINDRFGLRVTSIGAKENEKEKVMPAEKENKLQDADSTPVPLSETETEQGETD